MVWELWSGWEDHGGNDWKTVAELRLRLLRGRGPSAFIGSILEVYYRDNGNTEWIGPRHVDLGELGDTDHIFRLHSFGRFRSRQWRFRCAANVPINLISAEVI